MAVDPLTIAAIAAAAPAVYTTGKEIGKDVAGWFGWESEEKKQKKAADQLISNFMKNPGSQFVNPQLLARAQAAAGGGFGRDPNITAAAQGWIAGEGGIPYDTNLANQLLRGDIPPSMAAAMDRQIGTRFDRLRRNQGGQLARSGVLNSTIGGRLMADTYTSQRNALADAYVGTMLQRQGLGLNILGAADASRRAYQSMGANQLNRQADRDLAYQQLGFNVLSDADRRKYARETFGINARLGQLGMQQARRDASLEAAAGTLTNLYSNYQDQNRFDALLGQQNEQFSQLLNLSGRNNTTSPIQAKANLSAVSLFSDDSVMKPGNRFKTLGESRTGAGGYGARGNPLTSRY